jgi:hypothetical protein
LQSDAASSLRAGGGAGDDGGAVSASLLVALAAVGELPEAAVAALEEVDAAAAAAAAAGGGDVTAEAAEAAEALQLTALLRLFLDHAATWVALGEAAAQWDVLAALATASSHGQHGAMCRPVLVERAAGDAGPSFHATVRTRPRCSLPNYSYVRY